MRHNPNNPFNPFRTPELRRAFDTMLAAAYDRASELYLRDGSQHRGALHRCAFWDGYNGLSATPHAVPGALTWACYRAGQRFARETK